MPFELGQGHVEHPVQDGTMEQFPSLEIYAFHEHQSNAEVSSMPRIEPRYGSRRENKAIGGARLKTPPAPSPGRRHERRPQIPRWLPHSVVHQAHHASQDVESTEGSPEECTHLQERHPLVVVEAQGLQTQGRYAVLSYLEGREVRVGIGLEPTDGVAVGLNLPRDVRVVEDPPRRHDSVTQGAAAPPVTPTTSLRRVDQQSVTEPDGIVGLQRPPVCVQSRGQTLNPARYPVNQAVTSGDEQAVSS